MTDHQAFIRAHTALASPALVPEIRLYTATEITPIWQATEDWLAQQQIAPPFWAFPWPGSQAIARHILDHSALVAGKHVLDFAAGGGLAAIACALAGATHVDANEIDPLAIAAIALNAAENLATVTPIAGDIVGCPSRWDLILCGDICYEAPMARRILPWLRGLASSTEIWIADPGRAYQPTEGLAKIANFTVPTTTELEDRPTREVTLSRLLPSWR